MDASVQSFRCSMCDVSEVGFCGGMAVPERALLSSMTRRRSLRAGEVLFDEGQTVRQVSIITHGCVRLTRLLEDGRRSIVGFRFPGEFVGVTAGAHHRYAAEAVGSVELCQFAANRLDVLLDEAPNLKTLLINCLLVELESTQDQLVRLGRQTLEERIAHFLLGIEQRSATPCANSCIELPMSRGDIADYLGLTLESVSRCLNGWARAGVIHMDSPRKLRIIDRTHLLDLAGEAPQLLRQPA